MSLRVAGLEGRLWPGAAEQTREAEDRARPQVTVPASCPHCEMGLLRAWRLSGYLRSPQTRPGWAQASTVRALLRGWAQAAFQRWLLARTDSGLLLARTVGCAAGPSLLRAGDRQ